MPYFLKLCGFTGNFWKAVATIEGLKVDSRATAHSQSFVLAYYNAALPRVGIWLLSFDWFYSPRHATLGLCICHHPAAAFLWMGYDWLSHLWLFYETTCFFEAKQITEWTDYGSLGRTFAYLEEFNGDVCRCGPNQANTESVWLMKAEMCSSCLNLCAGTELFFISFRKGHFSASDRSNGYTSLVYASLRPRAESISCKLILNSQVWNYSLTVF